MQPEYKVLSSDCVPLNSKNQEATTPSFFYGENSLEATVE